MVDESVIKALEKIRDWAQDLMVSERGEPGEQPAPELPPPELPPDDSGDPVVEPEMEPQHDLDDELPPEKPKFTSLGRTAFHGRPQEPELPRKQPVGRKAYR